MPLKDYYYYYYLLYHPIAELVQMLISRMGESKYRWGNVGKGVREYQHNYVNGLDGEI